jgi:hypothetical protein
MNIEARRAYLNAVKERYNKSTKKQKTQILNEFCANCNYSRKHAIKLLKDKPHAKILPFKRKRPGKPSKYTQEAKKRLIQLWQIMDYPCSVKLKQALPLWLPYDLDTEEHIKVQLLAMGSSTIERFLKEIKRKRPKGKSTTTPSKFKSQIPLKLCKDDDKKTIGYFEADTVAHCGESLAGEFNWTLTMTDLHSGWTENRACPDKTAESVKSSIEVIESKLPFKLIGFSSDNGTEFLNQTVQDYLSGTEVTRGRPYKKNDNAHVEQKNFTHVRNLFGYQRFTGEVKLMNEIYKLANDLKNYYVPCLRLTHKHRIGSKIIKKYDPAKTPFQRLLDSGQLTIKQEEELRERKEELNPFRIKCQLDKKLAEFFNKFEKNRLETKMAA